MTICPTGDGSFSGVGGSLVPKFFFLNFVHFVTGIQKARRKKRNERWNANKTVRLRLFIFIQIRSDHFAPISFQSSVAEAFRENSFLIFFCVYHLYNISSNPTISLFCAFFFHPAFLSVYFSLSHGVYSNKFANKSYYNKITRWQTLFAWCIERVIHFSQWLTTMRRNNLHINIHTFETGKKNVGVTQINWHIEHFFTCSVYLRRLSVDNGSSVKIYYKQKLYIILQQGFLLRAE